MVLRPSAATVPPAMDLDRRRGARGIDGGAPFVGVALRDQALDRHLHHIGIAEKPGAIGVGALHRLDHQEQRLRLGFVRQIVALEDVEHLDERDAAR